MEGRVAPPLRFTINLERYRVVRRPPLRIKQWSSSCSSAVAGLVPAATSSYGGWHPQFVDWVRHLLRAAVAHATPNLPGAAATAISSAMWRVSGILAVASLQGTAEVLLAGAAHPDPGMDPGRPFSDTPYLEWWRAAPPEACAWAAAEDEDAGRGEGGRGAGGSPPAH